MKDAVKFHYNFVPKLKSVNTATLLWENRYIGSIQNVWFSERGVKKKKNYSVSLSWKSKVFTESEQLGFTN